MPELTLRALASGLAVGGILCVANLYMGLKTGIWDSGHVTASILAFALVSGRLSRSETNVAQTAATAAGAVPAAAGLLGAIPALEMIGRAVPGWGIALWGLAMAVIGILFGAGLRKRLLEEEKLPFPTGVATAEVIEALHKGASDRVRPLMWGGVVGAVLGWFRDGKPALIPSVLSVPGLSTYGIGISLSPLLWGVGMVVGLRIALSVLFGSVIGWGVLAPWLVNGPLHVAANRGAIWGWLSWPGTALMVGAAFVALLQQARAFAGALRDLRAASFRLDAAWLCLGVAAVTVLLGWIVFDLRPLHTVLALLVSILGASVCARAAGLTDLSPLGPVGQVTQAIYGGLAPGQPAVNIAAGSVVAGDACHAPILLWSLGSGMRHGTSPRSQVVAALAGSVLGSLLCAPAYLLLVKAFTLGSTRLPAPTGVQWKAMGEVVAQGLSALPPGALPAVAAAFVAGAVLAALGRVRWLPSAMAMGIGVLVPVDYSMAFVAGALLVRKRGNGAVLGAGLIAGDSLVGIAVALLMSFALL